MTERKDLIQDIETAAAQEIQAITADAKSAGYRLGQICATAAGETLEVLYTFEKDNILKNYKVTIDAKAPALQSVTAIYPYAFIYENEMHDLFGITFKNLSLDYGGKFFKIAAPVPWNPALQGQGDGSSVLGDSRAEGETEEPSPSVPDSRAEGKTEEPSPSVPEGGEA